MTTLSADGQTLLRQSWRLDGQLAAASSGPQSAVYKYADNWLLSSLIMHPPAVNGKIKIGQEIAVDRSGHPTHITDCRGLDVALSYDAEGRINSAVQKTEKGNRGYNIERDNTGRLLSVKSSWGDVSYNYQAGDLQSIASKCGDESAVVELSIGKVRKVIGFDKGVTTFEYEEKGEQSGALRNVNCANGLKLAHDYDEKRRLVAVAAGTQRRVRLAYDAEGHVTTYALEPMKP